MILYGPAHAVLRFVPLIYLHADILPHLTQLSDFFQREDVNFLATKKYVRASLMEL